MSTHEVGHGPTQDGASNADDAIVTALREHTELQVVAERFRQIADALERGDGSAAKDAAEGVEVHRRFLIGVHQRREALIAAELQNSVEGPVRNALAKCAAEHPVADRFQKEATAVLRQSPISKADAHRLAALMRAEADRFAEHHRWEADSIYHAVRGHLAPEVVERLTAAMRPLAGETAAAQTALTAWTSHANPASD
jgi:hypothetical protein